MTNIPQHELVFLQDMQAAEKAADMISQRLVDGGYRIRTREHEQTVDRLVQWSNYMIAVADRGSQNASTAPEDARLNIATGLYNHSLGVAEEYISTLPSLLQDRARKSYNPTSIAGDLPEILREFSKWDHAGRTRTEKEATLSNNIDTLRQRTNIPKPGRLRRIGKTIGDLSKIQFAHDTDEEFRRTILFRLFGLHSR